MTLINLETIFLFFCISSIIVYITYFFLKKIRRFDLNSFSLSDHNNVTTSLGLSFIICIFLISILCYFFYDLIKFLPNRFYIFYLSIFVLGVLSFIDDKYEVDAKLKLIIQLCLVYFSLTNLAISNLGLPLKFAMFLILVFWVYVINIVNFMDGSDGHCSVLSIHFFLGIILISFFQKIETFGTFLSFVFLIVLIPFMFLNYPRAKAYMGDTGSITLGYCIGYISLEFILMNKFSYIIPLLSYTFTDATITLIKKTFKGYYPWVKLGDYFFLKPIKQNQAHKRVFYLSVIHSLINLFILFLMLNFNNLLLILLSLISSILLVIYYNSFKNKSFK